MWALNLISNHYNIALGDFSTEWIMLPYYKHFRISMSFTEGKGGARGRLGGYWSLRKGKNSFLGVIYQL